MAARLRNICCFQLIGKGKLRRKGKQSFLLALIQNRKEQCPHDNGCIFCILCFLHPYSTVRMADFNNSFLSCGKLYLLGKLCFSKCANQFPVKAALSPDYLYIVFNAVNIRQRFYLFLLIELHIQIEGKLKRSHSVLAIKVSPDFYLIMADLTGDFRYHPLSAALTFQHFLKGNYLFKAVKAFFIFLSFI